MQGGADLRGIGFGVDAGDELPEIHRVAQVFMGPGWQVWMQRDGWGTLAGQVQGDGIFPGKPLRALAGALRVLHDPRHQAVREAENQSAAVLQDIAPVRRDAVGDGGFRGGSDGEFEGGHGSKRQFGRFWAAQAHPTGRESWGK